MTYLRGDDPGLLAVHLGADQDDSGLGDADPDLPLPDAARLHVAQLQGNQDTQEVKNINTFFNIDKIKTKKTMCEI